ncbi:MAG: ATP-binding cassette domain-containing protein, partial [Clostridium sp.]|uniref:ATP-binding cassette domain-containing protein n=1 Tax=Clostridium sp. TaxID=1506 RepID=UPI0025C6617D
MEGTILEMKNITKIFPGVKALDNVNLQVKANEIHALVGENGAGKSTLMNILSGIYPYGSYDGEIYFKERLCQFKNIKDSEKLGIVIIHQELALVQYLSIAENMFLGNEQSKNGIINWDTTINKSKELLNRVGLNESPETLIMNIGVGKQQLVEIAKALSKNVSLLILDEPTAALNDYDSEVLLNLLLELKKQGVSSILISHKLNEISKVADRITIIRDGATIETIDKNLEGLSEDRIIRGMVGRDIVDRFPKRNKKISEVCFEVKNWSVYDSNDINKEVIKNVNLNVRKGEIVGIAGLMGSGRTE